MESTCWRWAVSTDEQHNDRVALIREISYEMTCPVDQDGRIETVDEHNGFGRQAKGLSLNISGGGILVMMENAPSVERVVRLHVPTPVRNARTPTLAEVRWVRRVPFSGKVDLCLVGMKFLC